MVEHAKLRSSGAETGPACVILKSFSSDGQFCWLSKNLGPPRGAADGKCGSPGLPVDLRRRGDLSGVLSVRLPTGFRLTCS